MICKVVSTIEKYGLLEGVSSVTVGVSGGADSVCLLNILSSLKEKYGIILKAVHVNHNLRGDEALRDESFVRDICGRLGVELQVFSVDIKQKASELGVGEEECGRIIRYECFESMGCDAVAVAHSLSDSIETAFFNFARGTALKGLCGISPKRKPNIIRPLIECTRQEIEQYCQQHEMEYMTDSTNLTCDYMRNHIRHRLIPDVRHINGGFEKSIKRCMDSLSEDCEYLDTKAAELLENATVPGGYSASVLNNSHKSIRKRALSLILKEHMSKDVEARHILLFDSAVTGECDKVEIGKDMYITVRDDLVSVGGAAKDIEPWKCCFDEKGKAVTPVGTYTLSYVSEPLPGAIDIKKTEGELFISSRIAGDKITLPGKFITKSLKKLFNEMKIPAEERNRVAVLHDGKNVVWVEGVGVSYRYTPKPTSEELMIIKKEG